MSRFGVFTVVCWRDADACLWEIGGFWQRQSPLCFPDDRFGSSTEVRAACGDVRSLRKSSRQRAENGHC